MVVYAPGYFGNDSFGTFEELFSSGKFSSGYKKSFRYHLEGMLDAFENSKKCLMQSGRGGVFVYISSIAGSIGHNGSVLYAMSKAAADAAVKQLALEYGSYPLRVLSIAPGLTNTPALENLGSDRRQFLATMSKTNAMGRYADPIEVAEFIAFLSSERASFIIGGPYFIDGGAILRSPTGDALKNFTSPNNLQNPTRCI